MSLKSPQGYRARAVAVRKRLLQRLLMLLIIITLLTLIPVLSYNLGDRRGNERRELWELYESMEFEAAYTRSKELLDEFPLELDFLLIYAYSSYKLSEAQINNFTTQFYLDECIWALRRAMLIENYPPGLYYVLGMAYFYKGSVYSQFSETDTHFYADLSVYYLEKARAASYIAEGLPVYLGLSYAAIGEYRSSIEAFTLALSGEYSAFYATGTNNTFQPSDDFLLAIAQSYYALGEIDSARAYIMHCISISRDSRTITKARLWLGNIYFEEGDLDRAEAEYLLILEENSIVPGSNFPALRREAAETYYMLGNIYFAQGDVARARAAWRNSNRADPTYGPAINRLN